MRRSGSEPDEVGSKPAPPANSSYSILPDSSIGRTTDSESVGSRFETWSGSEMV